MRMYVKPSIEVIELQLKENIAAVPTTVYKGKGKGKLVANSATTALNAIDAGLSQTIIEEIANSTI